jgi:hypothetical protein
LAGDLALDTTATVLSEAVMAVGKGPGQSQFQSQVQNHKSWPRARAVQAKSWNRRGIEVF